MEISETKFEELCRSSERLNMLTDYIMGRAEEDDNYAYTDTLACMAGIREEAAQARKAAKEAKEAAKDGE